MSALKEVLENSVTVKQIPFTQMLSPIFKSLRIKFASISNWQEWVDFFIDLISPSSSTIPVNILDLPFY